VLAVERLLAHGEQEFLAAVDALDALIFRFRSRAMGRAFDFLPLSQRRTLATAQRRRDDSRWEGADRERMWKEIARMLVLMTITLRTAALTNSLNSICAFDA
jgi:hypothetical protein